MAEILLFFISIASFVLLTSIQPLGSDRKLKCWACHSFSGTFDHLLILDRVPDLGYCYEGC